MLILTRLTTLLFTLSLLGFPVLTLSASAQSYIVTLETRKSVVFADNKDTTLIQAYVRNTNGQPLTAPVNVSFQTSDGVLSAQQATAIGGMATVQLRSQNPGIARVTATAPGALSPGIVEVEFTDDPSLLFQGHNYMTLEGPRYLAYSVTDKVIQAEGKQADAHLTYRTIEISGDSLQLDCVNMVVRASGNVVLRRGKQEVRASRLHYNLSASDGYALAEFEGRQQIVHIKGDTLAMEAQTDPIPNAVLLMPELQVKLIVVSQGITYFPGERLLFRKPKFFQDQAQILALPYYEMGLYATELFSDQFFSVGTNGLGLELPFYYNLTPRSTGILFLRHQQQLGRGFFATNPGWSLDMVHGYRKQGDQPYEGAFELTGLTRGDWGFRFTHAHQFNSKSQGNFYLDFPQHRAVFSALNYTQQARRFRWGGYLTGGQTFGNGNDQTVRGDLFAETQPHRLANSKHFSYTLGANTTRSFSRNTLNTGTNLSEATSSLTMRAFSRPWQVDSRTTVGSAFTLGHTWSNYGTGPSALMSLNLDHTLPGGGAFQVNYDFINQPVGAFYSGGKHRMGVSYNVVSGNRLSASFFGSAFLDSADASFLGDLAYRMDNNWRLLTSLTLQTFQGQSFRDVQFTIGRRIGARELQLTYSTLFKRISLDFTATRF